MKSISKRIKTEEIAIALLTLFIFAFVSASIFAQETTRKITITPTVEVTANPGDIKEGTIKITNESTTSLTFNIAVRDFIVEDNKGTPTILAPGTFNEKYSAASWIGITPNGFTIEPGQTQFLTYYIQIPADAAPGGHYAAVMQEPLDLSTVEGSGTGVTTQLGTLFYIDIPGDIREEAKVTRFDTQRFLEYGPINITAEIQNNSDIHVRPRGTITLTNIFGRVVEVQNIPENNIFPEKSFLHELSLGKKFMVGMYKAELAASYGKTQNKPLTASATVIIFPWKIALITALIIIVAVLATLVIKRRRNRKNEEKVPKGTVSEEHPTPQS